jgi:hypothetical protein
MEEDDRRLAVVRTVSGTLVGPGPDGTILLYAWECSRPRNRVR